MIKVTVPAKVNLSLLILGTEDGYHRLDSVMASLDLTEAVTVKRAARDEIALRNRHGITAEKIQALIERMRKEFGFGGVAVTVENNVPLGGGLGGSSVACAGVIRAIDALFSLRLSATQKTAFADSTGSDTAFLLDGGCGRIEGRSKVSERFSMPSFPVAIACKGFSDTAKAFAAYDGNPTRQQGDNAQLISLLKDGKAEQALPFLVNDLQAVVQATVPEVREGLAFSPKAFMTGSGSGIVLPFPAKEEMDSLKDKGFWVFQGMVGDFATTVEEIRE